MAVDPVSLINGLVDLFGHVKELCDFVKKYKAAKKDLEALQTECKQGSEALQALKMTVSLYKEDMTPESSVRRSFNIAVSTMKTLLLELENQLKQWKDGKKSNFGIFDKAGFVWNGGYLQERLGKIQAQIPYFNFVMMCLNLQHQKKTVKNNETGPPKKSLKRSKSDNELKRSAEDIAKQFNQAITKGPPAYLEQALRGGALPDVPLNKTGDRALHIAAREGNLRLVELLLSYGARLGITNNSKETPLHQALSYGQPVTSAKLIDNAGNAILAAKNAKGRVALHYAVIRSLYTPAQNILDRGVNPNVKDNAGETPLLLAMASRDRDRNPIPMDVRILRLLMARGADPTMYAQDTGLTPVHELAKMGRAEELGVLVERLQSVDLRPSNNSVGATPLFLAVTEGHLDAVKVLLDYKADANATVVESAGSAPVYPLWKAFDSGYLEVAAALLGAGAKVDLTDKVGSTLFHMAARKEASSAVPMIELLFLHNGKVDTPRKIGEMALQIAACWGSPIVIKGETALHVAASKGSPRVVKALLDGGATVDPVNQRGETPFMFAAAQGRLAVMRTLLGSKADWKHATKDGETAFMMACLAGETTCASFLLGKGSRINDKTPANNTALHYATCNGQMETVRFLLDLGANKKIRSTEGYYPFRQVGTAAEVAKDHKHEKVLELLEKYEPV